MHKYAVSSWHHGKRYFSSNFSRRKMFSSMLVWVFCGFSHYTVTCGRSISRPKTSKEQQKCRFISDFWKFCCCSCQGSHSFIKVKTKTDYIHNLSSSVRDYILELGRVPENPKTQPIPTQTQLKFQNSTRPEPKKFSKPDPNLTFGNLTHHYYILYLSSTYLLTRVLGNCLISLMMNANLVHLKRNHIT